MSNRYLPLFAPIKLGSMLLKNRICMAPMAFPSEGRVPERYIDYFERRARGGAGLITTGASSLSPVSEHKGFVQLYDPNNVPGLSRLADRVHAGGAKLCVEITAGDGRNQFSPNNEPIYASSVLPVFGMPGVETLEMSIEQIQQIMSDTRRSIQNIVAAGVDCVNIHGHNGYLIDQFMSSGWNHRTDGYGGSFENRMRFVREIIQIVREEAGPDFPIIFRITLDHMLPGVRAEGETVQILRELERLGVNALDVDVACYDVMDQIFAPYYTGDAYTAYVTDMVREAGVKLPILNAGNHTPDTALAGVESGKFDITIMGRALIADPDLPNKLLKGMPEEVRPCLKCNMGCIQRSTAKGIITCAVNPETGAEAEAAAVKPCSAEQKVVIIGAGPAGLEAARSAALRGAKVTLVEKSGRLGGTARLIASPDWKYRFRQFFDWYALQLKKLGVEVLLNTELTADSPILEDAERIFVATGSKPIVPPIEGIELPNVVNVLDVHRDSSVVKGETVVICGGGMSGCEAALELAEKGKKVTVLDALPRLAKDCVMVNLMTLMRELMKNGVTMLPNTKVKGFRAEGVLVETAEGGKLLPADTAVHAFGIRPDRALGEELMSRYPGRVLILGDANKVNCIYDAIHDGYNAALSLT